MTRGRSGEHFFLSLSVYREKWAKILVPQEEANEEERVHTYQQAPYPLVLQLTSWKPQAQNKQKRTIWAK